MSLQSYKDNDTFFAPCNVDLNHLKAVASAAETAPETKGINVNVTEGPIGFGVTAVLPDLEEEDIVLQAEPGNVLSISAERTVRRTVQKQGKNRSYTSTEETSEFLRRSLKLPDSADLDRVNTSYSNGVLTLLIAKREGAVGQVDPQPVIAMD